MALIFMMMLIGSVDDCASPYLEELLQNHEIFRASTWLMEHEYQARGRIMGLSCTTLLLQIAATTGDYDYAATWLKRIPRDYQKLHIDTNIVHDMSTELAFLTKDYLGCLAQLKKLPTSAQRQRLQLFAAKLENPTDITVPDCHDTLCERLRAVPAAEQRDPAIALALGIIPGLGQAYGGLPLGGLASFIVNGIAVAGTYFAANHHEPVLATTFGTVAGILYLGNFYAGYIAALRFNEQAISNRQQQIRNIELPLYIYQASPAILLAPK